MQPLDVEEQEILDSVESGEWQSVQNLRQEIQRYQRYAQAQLGSLEKVSLELPASDFQVLQTIAQQSGISVSLLMASLLHQYVSSQFSSES
jgi:predicted DNA binding CopG/RHH family protein